MSQLVKFDNPKKTTELTKTRLTFDTAENVSQSVVGSIVTAIGVLLDSYSNTISPVKVVGDSIKIKEYLLNENEPYAFSYNNKEYVITKTNEKIKLYELSD